MRPCRKRRRRRKRKEKEAAAVAAANFQYWNSVAIRDHGLISTFKHFRLADLAHLLATLNFVMTGG